MSTVTYGRVTLSEEERRRRAEAERKRKEEEERRRKEAEERRKQQERDSADRLVAIAKELRDKIAFSRKAKPQRRRTRKSAEAPVRTLKHADKVEETRRAMLEIIETAHQVLTDVPDEFRRIHKSRLAGIERELANIESHRDQNFTTHFERLKWLKNDLFIIIDSPEEQIEEWHRAVGELEGMKYTIDELLAGDVPERLRTRTESLLEDISTHIDVAGADIIRKALPALRVALRSITDEIERERTQSEEHEILKAKIAETLEEMGYRAAGITSDRAQADASGEMLFRTPKDDAVRIVLDRDQMIRAEFVRICDAGEGLEGRAFDEAVARCQTWCDAVPALKERLRRRGVEFRIDSAMPAERGGFAVMNAGAFASEGGMGEEEEDFYTKGQDREQEIE